MGYWIIVAAIVVFIIIFSRYSSFLLSILCKIADAVAGLYKRNDSIDSILCNHEERIDKVEKRVDSLEHNI